MTDEEAILACLWLDGPSGIRRITKHVGVFIDKTQSILDELIEKDMVGINIPMGMPTAEPHYYSTRPVR